MDDIDFLTFDDVIAIHADQLAHYGGSDGVLDENVVRSATEMSSMRAFGQYLHEDIAAMAAAYLYHFAAAQGFVDGNKRAGLATCHAFLARNGYWLDARTSRSTT